MSKRHTSWCSVRSLRTRWDRKISRVAKSACRFATRFDSLLSQASGKWNVIASAHGELGSDRQSFGFVPVDSVHSHGAPSSPGASRAPPGRRRRRRASRARRCATARTSPERGACLPYCRNSSLSVSTSSLLSTFRVRTSCPNQSWSEDDCDRVACLARASRPQIHLSCLSDMSYLELTSPRVSHLSAHYKASILGPTANTHCYQIKYVHNFTTAHGLKRCRMLQMLTNV